MRFSVQREALLKSLAAGGRRGRAPADPAGAGECAHPCRRRQLSSFTGTDLEVELSARMAVDNAEDGETTVPARKLFDIVRALPDGRST
jgi:DNA polymerase-3 subunit beta